MGAGEADAIRAGIGQRLDPGRLSGRTLCGGHAQALLERRFEAIVRSDPDLMRLLGAIRGIRLPQWRLVAGCLYQTVWNVLTGRARATGISLR